MASIESHGRDGNRGLKLYDREEQVLALQDAYQRNCLDQPTFQREIVAITGPSGGKRPF